MGGSGCVVRGWGDNESLFAGGGVIWRREMAVRLLCRVFIAACSLSLPLAMAAVLAAVRGVVHDPQHRPIAGATVTLHAANSDFVEEEKTNTDGEFSFSAVPAGDYFITAAQPGFDTAKQSITVASNTSPVLHLELSVASVQQSVTVDTNTSKFEMAAIPSFARLRHHRDCFNRHRLWRRPNPTGSTRIPWQRAVTSRPANCWEADIFSSGCWAKVAWASSMWRLIKRSRVRLLPSKS